MRLVLPIGALAALFLTGCATNGALRRVETQVTVLRVESARRDSSRAAELERLIRIQEAVLDSLNSSRRALALFQAGVSGELTDVQRQLVQIQELTGQSQQRLSQLRADLEARNQAALIPQPVAPLPGDTVQVQRPPLASANQMYQASLLQFTRGSLGTARRGFQEYLTNWPDDERVPDALYYIGETFAVENPDSAVVYYQAVFNRFAASTRAPTALYKTGRAAEARNDSRTAIAAYERLLREYPRADEVLLARERLTALRP